MDTQIRGRFKDAEWFPESRDIAVEVYGAGGIGSWLTFFLDRIGYKVSLSDFDTVEEHNLGGQLFDKFSIGRLKTKAVSDIIYQFNAESNLSTISQKLLPGINVGRFVFAAFDNMEARKDLFRNWVNSCESNSYMNPIFIDGRLTMEMLQIYCVTYENKDRYAEEALFLDSAVEDEACTAKQSSHTASIIGATMTALFTNHYANIKIGEQIREVPFFYELHIPSMITTTV